MSRWLLGCLLAACTLQAMAREVKVVPDEVHQRVDITIDGQPFTAYLWPSTLKKPVLFPLMAADGLDVVRGFPLAPRPGERVDHPHHAGIWFNYGDVNGFDFWNNSDAIKPEDRGKMGPFINKRLSPPKAAPTRETWSSNLYGPPPPGRTFWNKRHATFFPGATSSGPSTRSRRYTRSIAPSFMTTRKDCSAFEWPDGSSRPTKKGAPSPMLLEERPTYQPLPFPGPAEFI